MATGIDGDDLLEEMATHMERELIKGGVAPEMAREKAVTVTESVRRNYAGAPVYIQQGWKKKHQERNKKIVAEFNGNNHIELAQKYGISMMRVYQIIKKDLEDRRKQKGGGLSMSGPSTANRFKVD